MEGLRVAGSCFSPEDALSKHYGGQPRAAIPTGTGGVLETSYVPCGSDWCRQVQTYDASGVLVATVVQLVTPPDFPACDPLESFWDGHAVGWLVFALVVGVGAFLQMREATK